MARKHNDDRGRRGYRPRIQDRRELRQRFLIICEGTKTEPNYFRSFRVPKEVVELDVLGLALDPLKLVQEAIRLRDEAEKDRYPFDQVWCVFDRDDWTRECFHRAIWLAREQNLGLAYTNEAFELWYLLHFDFYHAAISRDTYKARLSERLGFKYMKNRPDMYYILADKREVAIKNATRLLGEFETILPADANPSTTVHLLVKALIQQERP